MDSTAFMDWFVFGKKEDLAKYLSPRQTPSLIHPIDDKSDSTNESIVQENEMDPESRNEHPLREPQFVDVLKIEENTLRDVPMMMQVENEIDLANVQ